MVTAVTLARARQDMGQRSRAAVARYAILDREAIQYIPSQHTSILPHSLSCSTQFYTLFITIVGTRWGLMSIWQPVGLVLSKHHPTVLAITRQGDDPTVGNYTRRGRSPTVVAGSKRGDGPTVQADTSRGDDATPVADTGHGHDPTVVAGTRLGVVPLYWLVANVGIVPLHCEG